MKEHRILESLKKHYGIQGQLDAFDSYDDEIYRIATDDSSYILKIYHTEHNLPALRMQISLMDLLSNSLPAYEFPAVIRDRFDNPMPIIDDRHMTLHPFLSGKLMGKANPILPTTRCSLGEMLGSFQQVMDGKRVDGDEYTLTWDNAQIDWIANRMDDFGNAKKLIEPIYRRYIQSRSDIQLLRKSIIHNDANENNLFVQLNPENNYVVYGAIDFGDSIYTQTINDLAIACAYAMMGVPDPLEAAADIIRGYHEKWPLQPQEIEHLFILINVRLVNSLAHSTISSRQHPDNPYILVHSQPTIDLLEKLNSIDESYAHYYFRGACGWAPVSKTKTITEWIQKQSFYPIFGGEINLYNSTVWDLSVGSKLIGSLDQMKDTNRIARMLFGSLEDEQKKYGIGRYDEVRLLYSEDSFTHDTNDGPGSRTLHIGLDIFSHAGQPVYAPLEGKVILADKNDLPKDYGHVIVLEHHIDDENCFYTLYGHLSASSLSQTKINDVISKGQVFAWLGEPQENGDWVPHIHFQIMTDLLGNVSNFPGVADPRLRSLWLSLCPDPNLILRIEGLQNHAYKIIEPSVLKKKRDKVLPQNLSVSFASDPLYILRGHGVYLYDHLGQAYLDTVNNVAHVGHENTAVVHAGQQQMAVLNTNTRYLHKAIIDYANALLKKLPDHLEVVFFCNSGSEANDLAMRLAKNYTDATDTIILEQGYHGHTSNCINVSSYKFESKGGEGIQPNIHKLPMPDIYRGQYRINEAGRFAVDAAHQIQQIDQNVACFIGEAIISCGGQITPPSGYYKSVYSAIRAKGGVCIADEVQTGFGRVGDHFWAFQLHGIDPDIVTMGKPMGNGHPVAAVATTRTIAEAFNNGMEYFNTYGGNPVSCTIAQAVLDYIEDHNLQAHAKRIGAYLKQGLKSLQKDNPCFGDIRGHGLFLGIEIVDNRIDRSPSKSKTDYLVRRMKNHNIQMSTDGPDHNVIKIKPPLSFDLSHADRLLITMEKILKEDFMVK